MGDMDIAPQDQSGESGDDSALSPKRFNPQSYPVSLRHRVEIDYASKLTSEEQRWLACFNEAEYGSNPDSLRSITGQPVSDDERKRLRREIKRYQRDMLTIGPRIDIEYSFYFQDTQTRSSEDGLIGLIDSERQIERIVVDSLILLIKSKQWVVSTEARPLDPLTSKDEIYGQEPKAERLPTPSS